MQGSHDPTQLWQASLEALKQAQQHSASTLEQLTQQTVAWQQQAQQQWQELTQSAHTGAGLEGVFAQRVAQAMQAIGMPSVAQVQALQAQVHALQQRVEALEAAVASGQAPAPRASRARARKPIA
jgi:prefoldin subunit 5